MYVNLLLSSLQLHVDAYAHYVRVYSVPSMLFIVVVLWCKGRKRGHSGVAHVILNVNNRRLSFHISPHGSGLESPNNVVSSDLL